MQARSLVVEVLDRIRGPGRLVRTRDGAWFDPPLAVGLNWNRPAPTPSPYAVPIEGADVEHVGWRREQDGAVEGVATVYGRWLGDRIGVDRQTQETPDPAPPPPRDPPGPTPRGGRPISRDDDADDFGFIDVDHLQETGAATTIAVFRPDPRQAVLVVAAVDIAAVEAQLRPRIGDRLCIVASRWTREQVDGVQRDVWARAEQWGVHATGRSCDEQAQPVVTVRLVRVTDEIASWADTQPVGLVILGPCLRPIRTSGSDDAPAAPPEAAIPTTGA